LFLLVVFMRASAVEIATPLRYDISATFPLWAVWLVGLGYFVEHHLISSRGVVFRVIFIVMLGIALIVSAANAALDLARHNAGHPPRAVGQWIDPPVDSIPSDLGAISISSEPLPVQEESFFMPVWMTADWLTRAPLQMVAACRPGINNLPLHATLLLVVGLIPLPFILFARLAARRREEEDDFVEEDEPDDKPSDDDDEEEEDDDEPPDEENEDNDEVPDEKPPEYEI